MTVEHTDTDGPDIQATLQGDEHAFARLVARHQAVVFQQMWRFTRDRNEQDELVQEVFIEVYRSLRNFRGRAPFLHWLRRIATRVGYRYWKHQARDRRLREALDQRPIAEFRPPEQQDPSEAAEQLHSLLGRLAPKDRLILSLLYFDGCDPAEVAERMGWNANLVRVRAHRARQKLKKMLEDLGLKG